MSAQSKVLLLAVLGVVMPLAGCRDNTPAVPRVPVPQGDMDTQSRSYEREKPMPPQPGDPTMSPAPFDDPPLMVDTPPETKRFVEVYRQVGRPRIVVFVNRTLEGQLPYTSENRADTVKYDEIQARNIDYNMIETLMADWMSCDNQVTIMAPATVRRELNDQQIRELEAGRAPLSTIARQLDADVLVQLQAWPTKQTPGGLELRLVADAINLKGGESLARGSVDLIPPLDKPQANKYTRFMARKLMDGMSTTWASGATPAKADAPREGQ